MLTEVDAIPGPKVFPQFEHTFADRIAVTKVAGFQASDSNAQLGLRASVMKPVQPAGQRLVAIFQLVTQHFDHRKIVALNAQHIDRFNAAITTSHQIRYPARSAPAPSAGLLAQAHPPLGTAPLTVTAAYCGTQPTLATARECRFKRKSSYERLRRIRVVSPESMPESIDVGGRDIALSMPGKPYLQKFRPRRGAVSRRTGLCAYS